MESDAEGLYLLPQMEVKVLEGELVSPFFALADFPLMMAEGFRSHVSVMRRAGTKFPVVGPPIRQADGNYRFLLPDRRSLGADVLFVGSERV